MGTITFEFAGRGAALGAMDRLVEAGITRRELHLQVKDGVHVLVAAPADGSLCDLASALMAASGGSPVATAPAAARPAAAASASRARDDDWHAQAPPREKRVEEDRERAFAFGDRREAGARARDPDPELQREPGLRYADQDKPAR